MKKKIISVVCVLVVIIFAITVFVPKTFCGSSEIYTMDERKAAASLIKEHINFKEGCMLFLIKYEGDTVSKNNLDYCNELATDGKIYTDCVVFKTYFRSPIKNSGALEPNELYAWSYCLARTTDGPWEIVFGGYA